MRARLLFIIHNTYLSLRKSFFSFFAGPKLKIGPSMHVEESLQLGPAEEAPGKR